MHRTFKNILTNEELPYNTLSVKVKKMIETEVNVPLWTAEGTRLSSEELEKIQYNCIEYPDQTEEYINYNKFTQLFASNPILETRVLEYKAFFDTLNIPYTSNTQDIEQALDIKFLDDRNAKSEFASRMNVALLNVKVNYQAAVLSNNDNNQELVNEDITDFVVYRDTSLLIQYCPSNNPVQPEYREPFIVR